MNNVLVTSDRRNFIKTTVAATVGVLVLGTIKAKAQEFASDLKVDIGTNHGHDFTLSLAEIQEQGAGNFSIKGSSGHNHTIALTDELIAQLQAGQAVEIESSAVLGIGHSHIVTLEVLK